MNLTEYIKADYLQNSEVQLSEMLLHYDIPKQLEGVEITRAMAMEAIQELIEWDEIQWRYTVTDKGDRWEVYEIDTVELDGKIYPTRTLLTKHPEYGINAYTIAPESLLDVLEDYRNEDDCYDDDRDEAESIDNMIYHYVPDEYFYEEPEVICKYHLDTEFEFIPDEEQYNY